MSLLSIEFLEEVLNFSPWSVLNQFIYQNMISKFLVANARFALLHVVPIGPHVCTMNGGCMLRARSSRSPIPTKISLFVQVCPSSLSRTCRSFLSACESTLNFATTPLVSMARRRSGHYRDWETDRKSVV